MFDHLKENWQHLKESAPGERFQHRYERRQDAGHGTMYRVLCIGGGVLLMLIGIVLLAIPGPGILVIFVGGGLIAQESEVAARVLDWSEVHLRRLADWALAQWCRAAPMVKGVLVLLALAGAGALGFVAYRIMFA